MTLTTKDLDKLSADNGCISAHDYQEAKNGDTREPVEPLICPECNAEVPGADIWSWVGRTRRAGACNAHMARSPEQCRKAQAASVQARKLKKEKQK